VGRFEDALKKAEQQTRIAQQKQTEAEQSQKALGMG
jgi:hypothetical protein